MLDFVLPTEQNRSDVLAFYGEIESGSGACIGIGNYRDYGLWLNGMRNRRAGENLPDGYVRENFYLCYEGPALVGVFSLKFELTEYLLNYGGHIGYAVRPSERGRGLATQMLAQGLEIARQFGFARVLCICDDDNRASERVIQKNSGELENELFDPAEHVTVKRYWIQLTSKK